MKQIKLTITLISLFIFSVYSFAQSVEEKEMSIQNSSKDTLTKLIDLKNSGQLNDDSALQLIQDNLSSEFDFPYLTQRVLGKNWRNASDGEKSSITSLYKLFLERTYAKSFAKFDNQEIEFIEAIKLKNDDVRVGINIVDNNRKVKIEYDLTNEDSVWKIKDIKIENVSLLGSYRRQFNSIIRKNGFEGLMQELEKKNNA